MSAPTGFWRDFFVTPAPDNPPVGVVREYADLATGEFHIIDSNGDNALAGSLNPALNPSIADGLQFVSPEGKDSNDALSWGTAKLTIMAAYDALPSTGGVIYISSRADSLVAATSVPGQGIWIMGPADPNYANPPAGWRKAKPVSFIGLSGSASSQQGHSPVVPIKAGSASDDTHPGIWLSSTAACNFRFENLLIQYPQIAVVFGYDSNGNASDESGAVGLQFMDVITNISNSNPSTLIGPGWKIGAACFDVFIDSCVIQGNANVTDGADNGSAVLINPKGHASSSITIRDTVVEGGPIKYHEGGTGGALFVYDSYSEGIVSGSVDLGTVWFADANQFTSALISNVQVADNVGKVYSVRVDGNVLAGNIVVVGSTSADVFGPAMVLGGIVNDSLVEKTSALALSHAGFHGMRINGYAEFGQRIWAPSTVPFANIAPQDAGSWMALNATLTGGQLNPWGGTDATEMTSVSGVGAALVVDANHIYAIGDHVLASVWVRAFDPVAGNYSQTAGQEAFTISFIGGATLFATASGGTSDPFSSYPQSSQSVGSNPSIRGNGGWERLYVWGTITATDGFAQETRMTLRCDSTHPMVYYAPMLLIVPASTLPSDNEIADLAVMLGTYPDTASVGDVAMMAGQRLSIGGSTAFFGKLTHANSADRIYTFPDQAGAVLIGGASGFGDGSFGTAVTTTAKGTGTGPANPQTIAKYIPVLYEGSVWWLPAMQ